MPTFDENAEFFANLMSWNIARAESAINVPVSLAGAASWERCARVARLYNTSLERKRYGTARWLRVQLLASVAPLESIGYDMRASARRLPVPRPYCGLSRDQLILEMTAVRKRFKGIMFNRRHKLISVKTAPIEMEGVKLGQFKISIKAGTVGHVALDQSLRYSITALTPNFATYPDSRITHPHVRAGALCEGEGSAPIKNALDDGRLLDFFEIVNSILHTYNNSSPFHKIERWGSIECSSCGEWLAVAVAGRCQSCSITRCDECKIECSEEGCGVSMCRRCARKCRSCGNRLCRGHVLVCRSCNTNSCRGCLNERTQCRACAPVQVGQPEAVVHPDSLESTTPF